MLFIAPLVVQPTQLAHTVSQTVPLADSVPFYSQFADITSPSWKKVGCGVTSLAMVIDYYKPNAVSVNTLLKQGIARGAYDYSAGWTYSGLIGLANSYGLSGEAYDYGSLPASSAFAHLKQSLADGPVIASVHYTFKKSNPIPHLVVIDKMGNDVLYYNDPAAKSGELKISVADFMEGWKKRYIVVRPKAAPVVSAST